MPPARFFLLRTDLATPVLLCFSKNFKLFMSTSVKSGIGILMKIGLNLWIAFVKIATFTNLILTIHETGRPLHLLMSASICFFSIYLYSL